MDYYNVRNNLSVSRCANPLNMSEQYLKRSSSTLKPYRFTHGMIEIASSVKDGKQGNGKQFLPRDRTSVLTSSSFAWRIAVHQPSITRFYSSAIFSLSAVAVEAMQPDVAR